jgi:hypothetical protein
MSAACSNGSKSDLLSSSLGKATPSGAKLRRRQITREILDRRSRKECVCLRKFGQINIVLEPTQRLGHALAMDPLPPPLAFFVQLFAGWVNRQQRAMIDYLLEENRVLRAAQGSRRLRLADDQRRRLAVKGKVLGRRRLAAAACIVTPDTILRWYRRLVATKYDGANVRRPDRPSTKPDIVALVVRMAAENPTWGYTRIRCGLKRVGHDVGRNTIKTILKDHGIEPAPERGAKTS